MRLRVELDASTGFRTGMLAIGDGGCGSSNEVSAVKNDWMLDWYEKLRLSERPSVVDSVESERLSAETGGMASVSIWWTMSDSSCHRLRFHELMDKLSPSS